MTTSRHTQIMKMFGNRLRKARKAAGYSSAQHFAGILGKEPHTYRHYERGEAEPDFDTLTTICQLLKVTPGYLLPEAEAAGVPNKKTIAAMKDVRKGKVKRFNTVADLMTDLDDVNPGDTIGRRLRDARKARGFTLERVGKFLEITPQAVQQWEKDVTVPDVQRLERLARLLEVDVGYILTGKQVGILELRKARIAKGFSSAAEAARYFGWKESTYVSHENGTRGIRKDAAKKYARAFGIGVAALLGLEPESLEISSSGG